MAAAPAGGRPAGGRVEVRQLPDPRRDLPRVPRRRVRPRALREILDGVRRREIAVHAVETPKASAFASSLLFDYIAAVHVRGRRAAGRAPGAGAHAGPRPAARAAGPGGAARAARSRGARGPRAEPPGARRRAARRRPGPGPRPPAAPRRPVDRRGGREDGRRAARGLAPPRGARRVAARRPGTDRRRGALDRDGGRRALPGRRRRRRRRRACRRRSWGPRSGRSTGCWPGMPGRTARSWRAEPARRWGLPSASSRTRCIAWSPRARLLSGEFRPGGAEREYCDPEVLRLLRRRSLAKLRREVEPVDPITLARFLPAWQGVAPSARPRPRSRRRCAARTPSSGWPRSSTSWPACRSRPRSSSATCCRPASPATSRGCSTSSGAMGEVAWVGRGSLGRDDGRVVLYRPGRELLRPTRAARRRRAARRTTIHERVRAHLAAARRLVLPRAVHGVAAGGRTARCSTRCGTWSGRARSPTTRSRRCARSAGSGRRRTGAPRPGRLTPLGPPEAAGRWSLVERPDGRAARRGAGGHPTERAPRAGARAARAARRRHPRGGRERGDRGRVLRRLPGPAGDGGGRPDPARLLRRRPGRRPVRARRARSTGCGRCGTARRAGRRRGPASSCWRRPTRPTRTARRCPGRAAATPTGGRSSGPPAPTWSLVDGAAVALPRPRRRPRSRRSRRPTIRRSLGAALASLARPRRRRPGARARDREGRRRARRRVADPRRAVAAGFVAGYRGYALRSAAPTTAAARPSVIAPSADARGRHARPDRGGTPAVPRRSRGSRGAGAAGRARRSTGWSARR